MAKKVNDMIIDMKAYGVLMEACWREAERIVSFRRELTAYTATPVGIGQVDGFLGAVNGMLKNLSFAQAVPRIARLLFQAAIRDEEDHVADTV